MIGEIKSLRVRIDGIAKVVLALQPFKTEVNFETTLHANSSQLVRSLYHKFNSAEIANCHDSLLLAKAWLGKVLQELGNPTPYKKDGDRHTVADIEPTADVAAEFFSKTREDGAILYKGVAYVTHIEKVDVLRQVIQEVIKDLPHYQDWIENEVEKVMTSFAADGSKEADMKQHEMICKLPDFSLELSNCYTHLSEARFHLGFELQRIKESDVSKPSTA